MQANSMKPASHDIFDLIVVGAGPAGMAAAAEARAFDMSVAILDQNAGLGGQIYRNVANSLLLDSGIFDPDYLRGSALVADVQKSGAVFLGNSAVWGIECVADRSLFSIGIMRDGVAERLLARRVVLATGALERPLPIEGWTLPGVMSVGAAQTLLKRNAVVPAGRTVLAGTGPLLYLFAAQLARASCPPVAVLDTSPRSNWVKALLHLPGFMASNYFRKGLSLMGEVKRSSRIILNVKHMEARGEEQFRWLDISVDGRSERIEADLLLLHQGVVPQVNLAKAAGCSHEWNSERLAFEPLRDEGFRSSVSGLSIAGDGGGVRGAQAAELEGRIAATQIAGDMGITSGPEISRRLQRFRSELAKVLRGRRFLSVYYRPAPQFRMPADDVIICRCEEVTAGSVREAAARGASGPNQLKLFVRAGMGQCQGRLCGLTVTELMAGQQKKMPGEIGYFHIRAPVCPITVGALAELNDRTGGRA